MIKNLKSKYSVFTYRRPGVMSSQPVARFDEISDIVNWLKTKHPNIVIGSRLGNFTVHENFIKAPWIKNINKTIRNLINK
jgi:hypothetical protein